MLRRYTHLRPEDLLRLQEQAQPTADEHIALLIEADFALDWAAKNARAPSVRPLKAA
jgi:hypothetical protein